MQIAKVWRMRAAGGPQVNLVNEVQHERIAPAVQDGVMTAEQAREPGGLLLDEVDSEQRSGM